MKHILPFHEYYSLNESSLDILYHATTLSNAASILMDDKFYLSAGVSSDSEGNGGKMFFMSCSREKFSGYARSANTDVTLVLDGQKLSSRYKTISVDYYNQKGNYSAVVNSFADRGEGINRYLKNVESEERVLSDTSTIYEFRKYILEMHVYLPLSFDKITDETYKNKAAHSIVKIDDVCHSNNIKVYYYIGDDNIKSFQYQDKRKAKTNILDFGIPEIDFLSSTDSEDIDTDDRYSDADVYMETFKKLIAIYKSDKYTDIPEDIVNFAYRINWSKKEIIEAVENDLRNLSRASSHRVKQIGFDFLEKEITPIMRKEKVKTIRDFVDVVVRKLRTIISDYEAKKSSIDSWLEDTEHLDYLLNKGGLQKADRVLNYDSNPREAISRLVGYLNGDKHDANILSKYNDSDIKDLIQAIRDRDEKYSKR